jgi:hypothetical protein
MFPRVLSVRHAGEYRLHLEFSDGVATDIDFTERIRGRLGLFAALQDLEFFRQVRLEEEAGTIVWPNGLDLCPDVLYSLATGRPIEVRDAA